MAGIRRDPSEFGGSKLFIPQGGFQTMPSKANDVSWDDEDMGTSTSFKKQAPPDEDVPF
jgi:hypothetical protein